MWSDPLVLIALVFAVLAVLLFIATYSALKKRSFVGTALQFLLALLMLSLAALCGTVSVGIKGYHALTKEEQAAVVKVEPAGAQKFTASFTFPDGSQRVFPLLGDQLYVDAHILKWRPVVNILGMHTSYKLDRVAGRYADIDDEKNKARTVYSLSKERGVDMFDLRRRFSMLSPLVDAEYGSATFIGSNSAAEYRVLVSTTGLLIRNIEKEGK